MDSATHVLPKHIYETSRRVSCEQLWVHFPFKGIAIGAPVSHTYGWRSAPPHLTYKPVRLDLVLDVVVRLDGF